MKIVTTYKAKKKSEENPSIIAAFISGIMGLFGLVIIIMLIFKSAILVANLIDWMLRFENNSDIDRALKDPIILKLAQKSVNYETGFMPLKNGCNDNWFWSVNALHPLYCDSLDLRLKTQGYRFKSSKLVHYYLDKVNYIDWEQSKNNREKLVIDMAQGKGIE